MTSSLLARRAFVEPYNLFRKMVAFRPWQKKTLRWVAARFAVTCSLLVAVAALSSRLPWVDHATVALLMVVATTELAIVWGWLAALTSAIFGAVAYSYFLPPTGLSVSGPKYLVALVAFVVAALTIGQLTARSKRLLEERNTLFQLSMDPLCIRSPHGEFQLVNPAMASLLGCSPEELCASSFLDFVHPDDRQRTEEAFSNLSHNSVAEFENRYRTKNGEWCWLRWRISSHAASVSRVLATARDVTREKRAEEKLSDLAAQLMDAHEEERRRISRELHDDVTQRLASLGIEVGLLARPAHVSPLEMQEQLAGLQAQLMQVSEDIRKLSHSLHPNVLEHSDLASSLEMLCGECTAQHGLAVQFTSRNLPLSIARATSVALYRISQEALRNVVRHACATEASVLLAGEPGSAVSLYVIDNGSGFDPESARLSPGLGLVSIEERARRIGASLAIHSEPGAGTRLVVRAPLAAKGITYAA